MKKGISPLVATVILIAATMSLAGILTFWVSSFVPRTLQAAENATDTTCVAAQFRLYSGTYSSTDKKMVLILENQRLAKVDLDKLYLFYSNNELKSFPINGTLGGNELKTFNITGIDSGFLDGEIRSTCPGVVAKVNCGPVLKCT